MAYADITPGMLQFLSEVYNKGHKYEWSSEHPFILYDGFNPDDPKTVDTIQKCRHYFNLVINDGTYERPTEVMMHYQGYQKWQKYVRTGEY